MNYKTFGNTGLSVSELALGTGNFGTGWGYGADPEASKAIFNGYAQDGGNFIDTADVYQFGQSEALLGGGATILYWRQSSVMAPQPTLIGSPQATTAGR